MTFRNTVLFFLIFLLLNSCKGLQYYKSATNPSGISVVLQCPTTYYTNIETKDSISIYLINHNSKEMVIPHWWTDLFLIGQSRFYTKEVWIQPQPLNIPTKPLIISPSDTAFLISLPVKSLLGMEKNWTYKTKNVWGPHRINAKKHYPYIYLTAEFTTKIPNQEELIKIRSEKIKVMVTPYKEQKLKNKKTELGLSSDITIYNVQEKKGNLFCKVNNLSEYPIQLFNDPGSIRFKLYAYNPNRTAIMFTQYVLDNGKLPVNAVSINAKTNYTITISMEQILFMDAPKQAMYYWTWNKKTPPISPLVYGKKDLAMEVEFWFGVVVDGKEFLSNTLKILIHSSNKKSSNQ